MLTELRIQNLAIISNSELNFSPGLTVITGESGAGKSLIVDAIELLLGKQGNDDYIKTGQSTCLVEATFTVPQNEQNALLQTYSDGTDTFIITRKLQRQKPSQARINGETVPLKQLKELAPLCIQLTSQHDTQLLFDTQFQRSLLDHYIGEPLSNLKSTYTTQLKQLKELQKKKSDLNSKLDHKDQRLEFLAFQIQDIEEHHFKKEEENELNDAKQHAKHAKKLHTHQQALSTGLQQVTTELQTLVDHSSEISAINNNYTPIHETLHTTQIQLDELQRDINTLSTHNNHYQDQSIDDIESRLDTIFTYKTKYKMPTLDALLDLLDTLKKEQHDLEQFSTTNDTLDAELKIALDNTTRNARKISQIRKEHAQAFATYIQTEMAELHFNAHAFSIQVKESPDLLSDGQDLVTFYVSTNPGEPEKELHKIASGGELSRIMLALKTVQTTQQSAPTLVFDEIDTGTGGLTATSIGKKLQTLSKHQQVLCITHLSQIAQNADHHLHVEKNTTINATDVQLRYLNPTEKGSELVRMVGGTDV